MGGGEWQDREYSVELSRTRCNYGGERVWFRCPARGCGRRVAVLYGGAIFACRKCHRLAYASQRADVLSRALGRADKIRARLRWKPGIAFMPGERPKGMHWKTYERFMRKYLEAAELANAEMCARFVRLDIWLEDVDRLLPDR